MFKSFTPKVKPTTYRCNNPYCRFSNNPQTRPDTYNCRGCSRGTYKVSDRDATLAQAAIQQPYTYRQDPQDVRRIQEESQRRKEEAYVRKQEAAIEIEVRKQEMIRARLANEASQVTRKTQERRAKLMDRLAEDQTLERRRAIRRKPGSSDGNGYTSGSSDSSLGSCPPSSAAHPVSLQSVVALPSPSRREYRQARQGQHPTVPHVQSLSETYSRYPPLPKAHRC